MGNDSSTGGPLLSSTPPVNDAALDQIFAALISQLTGLAPAYVRPRWQAEPAAPPDFGATWAAVGASAIDDDQYPVQSFEDGTGVVLISHEKLDVLCSFYGPQAQAAAKAARDGVLIDQNREGLGLLGIAYVSRQPSVRVPVLIQTRWTNRIDVTLTFRRQIEETYDVLSVLSAPGTITADAENLPTGLQVPLKPN